MFKSINNGILPERKTEYSSGYDVYSNIETLIKSKEIILIPLGIKIDKSWIESKFDKSFYREHFLGLYIRSSLALDGLMLQNSVGIIDMDYSDEIKMILYNQSEKEKHISLHDRIGQLILHPHNGIKILGKLFSKDKSRTGGFGSTNI